MSITGTTFITAVGTAVAVPNTMTVKNVSGSDIAAYPLQFGRMFMPGAIAHSPQVLVGGNAIATQADVKNRWPDGSVKFAVIAAVLPLTNGVANAISFSDQPNISNTPMPQSDMEAMLPVGMATMALTPPSGPVGSADAGQMLADGNYKFWTQGPIAQTIELADDSAAGAYDIGFDGLHRPFRPRFYATFWPATSQVFLRMVGENGKTTELRDLQYALTLKAGSQSYSADLTGASAADHQHFSMGSWTREFWLGGAPPAQVNIDYNIKYLTSTRFIPNFNPTVVISDAVVAAYDSFATSHNIIGANIYDPGWWTSLMSQVGGRMELGPYPAYDIAWLYNGDWRMRRLVLTQAALGAAFPALMRETASGKRMSRYDVAGTSTGLGHTMSVTDRGVAGYTPWYLLSGYSGPQAPVVVGPILGVSGGSAPWTFENAHQPGAYYIPYLMTGDPWYLSQMFMWAGRTVYMTTGATDSGGRGPMRTEGNIYGEERAYGWTLRNRADTAFIAPDGTPEKEYFTYLTNDALAAWSGMIGIADPVFQNASPSPGATLNMYNWGKQVGNHQSQGAGLPPAIAGTVGQLGVWSASNIWGTHQGTAADKFGADVLGADASYMVSYINFGIGHAMELGFQANKLFSWAARYVIGITLDSGLPIANGDSNIPTASKATQNWYQSYAEMVNNYQHEYATGVGGTFYTGGLPAYFRANFYSYSYLASQMGIAAMAFNEPRGDQTWAWFKTNVGPAVMGNNQFTPDPRWYFAPRTDGVTPLPAIPVH